MRDIRPVWVKKYLIPPAVLSSMAKNPGYPKDLTSQLKPDDVIVKYLPLGGKGKQSRGFIAITEQRIVFKAVAYDAEKKSTKEATLNVPVSKVSSMIVKHETISTGCLSKEHQYSLEVNVQGAQYNLPFSNDPGALEAANEFVRTFLECSE